MTGDGAPHVAGSGVDGGPANPAVQPTAPIPRRANPDLVPADESELAAWQTRAMPRPTKITTDLWVIPVPAPGLAVAYTFCYVIRDTDGLRVVDPGLGTALGWETFTQGLADLGSDVTQIRGVIGTHAHPDHTGLVGRIRDASGAWFALGAAEPLPPTGTATDEHIPQDDALLATWGVPESERHELNIYRYAIRSDGLGDPDLRLRDGEEVPGGGLITLATPGHTTGHISLRTTDGSFLFTGDHVLPRIVPHVSVALDSGDDPLGAYRRSLAALTPYTAALVCPAHEYRFWGLAARLRQLEQSVAARTRQVGAIIARERPDTVWQTAQMMTWSRGWPGLVGMDRRLAVAEAASHIEQLRYTVDPDRLPRTRPAPSSHPPVEAHAGS